MDQQELHYWEIYYTSSEQGIQHQSDGFGVRAMTEGLPKGLIEQLKSDNFFYYESGSRPLPSTYDLEEDPSLPLSFPQTMIYTPLQFDGHSYYLLSRTVFLGKDYGWYLEDQQENARSGNTFTHTYIFKTYAPQIFHYLLQKDFFRPSHLVNDPSNPELRSLLTGVPSFLESAPLSRMEIPKVAAEATSPKGLALLFLALQKKLPLVIDLEEKQTYAYWVKLMAYLPHIIKRYIRIKSNHQGSYFDPKDQVYFVNTYYQHELHANSIEYILCQPNKEQYTEILDTPFFQWLHTASSVDLISFVEKLDYMLVEWSEEINLEELYIVFEFLFAQQSSSFERKTIVHALQAIKHYALKPTFRSQLNQLVIDQLVKNIKDHQVEEVQLYLELIEELAIEEEYTHEIRQQLTHFLLLRQHFLALLKGGMSMSQLYQVSDDLLLQKQLPALFQSLGQEKKRFEQLLGLMIENGLEDFEATIQLTLKEAYCQPTFYTNLLNKKPISRFKQLLIQSNFFVDLPKDHHDHLIKPSLSTYIEQEVSKGPEARTILFEQLQKAMIQAPYALEYSRLSLSQILLKTTDHDTLTQMLDHLLYIVKQKVPAWENYLSKEGRRLFQRIQQQSHYFRPSAEKRDLWNLLSDYQTALKDFQNHQPLWYAREEIIFLRNVISISLGERSLSNFEWPAHFADESLAITFFAR
ncbi:MAG: hypothetical protein AAFP19_23320, partial [Bacteroidota bacterium]